MEDNLPREQTLTLINFGDGESDKDNTQTRVTISPAMVNCVIASTNTVRTVNGLELRKVNVLMTNGDNIELFITLLDLDLLETCIGFYLIGQE